MKRCLEAYEKKQIGLANEYNRLVGGEFELSQQVKTNEEGLNELILVKNVPVRATPIELYSFEQIKQFVCSSIQSRFVFRSGRSEQMQFPMQDCHYFEDHQSHKTFGIVVQHKPSQSDPDSPINEVNLERSDSSPMIQTIYNDHFFNTDLNHIVVFHKMQDDLEDLESLDAFKDFVGKNQGTKLLELKNFKIGMVANHAKVAMEVENFINVDTIEQQIATIWKRVSSASITNGLSASRRESPSAQELSMYPIESSENKFHDLGQAEELAIQIDINVNFDTKIIKRELYSWFDLLSEIGSLLALVLSVRYALLPLAAIYFIYHFKEFVGRKAKQSLRVL